MLKISNLGFAAFLMLKEKKLLAAPTKEVGNGKFEFYFNISQDDHDILLHEHATSDFSKFDNNLINLKKMLSGKNK
jgi:hypothetical protein